MLNYNFYGVILQLSVFYAPDQLTIVNNRHTNQ